MAFENHYAYSDKDVGWQGGLMEPKPASKPAPKTQSQRMRWCESRGVRFRLHYLFGWRVYYRRRCIQDSGTLLGGISLAEAYIREEL